MKTDAQFSSCYKYRYSLSWLWGELKPSVLFILLNPSTPDNPTLRRCLNFSRSWQFGQLLVGNLFAYKTSSPVVLFKSNDPVGKLNDKYLLNLSKQADQIIIAWGNHGLHKQRSEAVLKLLSPYKLQTLGLTKLNQPKHPLYLKTNTCRQAYLKN